MSSSKIDRKKLRYVRGTVRNKYGQLLSSGTINVYDRDLRNRQLLGRSELKEGEYSIEYTAEKFMRADKESADVVVELVGGKNNLILHTSEVQFNVPVDFTYDISLGERVYQGPSDWEKTGQTLLPLLDGVDVLEIREDDKHQDVSFISAEAGVEPLLIGNWLACHHLEQRAEERKLELPAPFFYAFLKQGHPALFYDDLLADIQHPERVDLLLDKMLREITEVDEKLQRNLFEKALTNNLVPADLAEKADHFFRELDRLRDQYTGDRPAGAGKGTIREILAIDNEMAEVGDRFITAYAKHRGTPAQFWTKLEKEADIKPETVTKLRTTFEVSGLTRNHVPLVRVLTDKQLPGRVLAGYDQQQWVKMLGTKGVDGQKVGAPDNIDGADEKERLVNYAIILERRFERQYPTAALSARLAPKMMGRLKQTKRIQRFLEENPDFQLDRYRIDHYLQENEGAGRALDAEGEAKSEIKALQRVFKIAPTTRGVTALLSAGVESAQQVYFMGPNRFSQLTESAGLTRLDSKRMFQRAENAYAMAVALFGNFNAGINGLNPFGISPFHLTAETAERLKALPDLQTLFGNMDFCACKHCRSVYGPAAYFVDVLRFLGERDSNGTTQNAGRSVRDVLLARRPDLGEIELSCENTNTPLPYIDLVNEILEDVVAPPDSPANRQTTLTAAELRAAPEHLNLEAYDVLAEAVYPHHLPFNLHELQRDAYLNHLGTPPAAFIERFSGPGLRADAAYLGIPEARLAVITGTAGSFTSADFWGYGGITGWVDALRSVSTFLHRAAISYPELLQLLAVEYVNPNGRVTVNDNPDGDTANCDLTTFRLRFVTVPFLDRAHRFLRLWRALKLPMWTIGDLIADLGGQPSANFIQDLATRKRVKDRLDLDWDELRSCYRDIPVSPVNIYTDKGVTIRKGHYAELFLNPLLESTNPFPEDPTTLSGPISDWTTGILGALRISEEELDFLLAERGLNQTTATNLSLLSDLYRSVLLARSLRLTLHDLATLATVAGMDPFPTAQGTLNFLDIVDTVKSGPFSVEEIAYLLGHGSAAAELQPTEAWAEAILVSIAGALEAAAEQTDDQQREAVLETVANELGLEVTAVTLLLDPDAIYETLTVTPSTDGVTTLRGLHRAGSVISELGLTAGEAEFWNVPFFVTRPLASSPQPLLNTILYVNFREDQRLETDPLLAFLETTTAGGPVATTTASLSELLGAERVTVDALATHYGWGTPADFADMGVLRRLATVLGTLQVLGISPPRAIDYASRTPDAEVAEGLKQAAKAKYDLGQWREILRPLQDAFRHAKRNALVAYLTSGRFPQWPDANALYGYFLIDVEMSACMLTSRLKQASASAQLFVQRCQLNLEYDLEIRSERIDDTDTIADRKWRQWKWMRYYRVWEANYKIFLYPESFIEPQLRDDKSPFFRELEEELLKHDVTDKSAQDAFRHYLEKLDAVANLEPAASHREYIPGGGDVWHVFGRTRGSMAPETWYRQRINGGRWTAWTKTELEIPGKHLEAGMHNKRLYLFWPQLMEQTVEPSTASIPSDTAGTTIDVSPDRYWEIRMFSSELREGVWSPRKLSEVAVEVDQDSTGGGRSPRFLSFKIHPRPHLEIEVFASPDPDRIAPHSRRARFQKLGPEMALVPKSNRMHYEHLIAAPGSEYRNGLLWHTGNSLYFYYDRVEESGKYHSREFDENALSLRILDDIDQRRSYSLLDSANEGWSDEGAFFFYDPRRSYAVDYRRWREGQSNSLGFRVVTRQQFDFRINYHPFVELFTKELNIWGVPGLLNRRIQVDPESINGAPPTFDFMDYEPTSLVRKIYPLADGTMSFPVEDVDFSYGGAYSGYNWELFFHAPFHIANQLATNQQFADALEWYHYIFNPTSTDATLSDPETPQQRFWITKPFYETTKGDYYAQKIENLLSQIARGDTELEQQVSEWRDNPFNPHLIARMRTVAYQKAVLIKYITTIIAWGDQLFRRNTMETINEATQLYVLADSILGKRPVSVPKSTPNDAKTFNELLALGLDALGNASYEIENLVGEYEEGYGMGEEAPELPRLNVLYFCIPNNERLLTLWDTVADRLYKIRHCMNIEGQVQQLPLFQPPIDPSALVAAAAGGGGLDGVLAALSAPLPNYRFTFMMEKARNLATQVQHMGSALLAALEKRDAEAFARLRAEHEVALLAAEEQVYEDRIREAELSVEVLEENRAVTEKRHEHYKKLVDDGKNGWELAATVLYSSAIVLEVASGVSYLIAAALKPIPDIQGGAAGFGGSPTVTATTGGSNIGGAMKTAAKVLEIAAKATKGSGALVAKKGTEKRREQDWKFRRDMAEAELPGIDKQIERAELNVETAKTQLVNHQESVIRSEKEQDYLYDKWTNEELYDWMVSQLSTVYFQAYQLAFDVATRAEHCYRYELGVETSNYVQFGHWDSLRKGLLSGTRLLQDLNRLENAYCEQNDREYELTKHVSLAQLDPIALLTLRETGECFLDIPEAWFDLDFPGHYFRRIKGVRVSVPCVTGPNTTVACTLTMSANSYRINTNVGGNYARDTAGADVRFRDGVAAQQSIATSTGRQDPGMFEFNFRDERYLPFEGAGAISSWRIRLNGDLRQFDHGSITDVILHLNYTAREGGDALATAATEAVREHYAEIVEVEGKNGLIRVLDVKREFANAWQQFLNPAAGEEQVLQLANLRQYLPYFTRPFGTVEASQLEVVARGTDGTQYEALLSPLGVSPGDEITLVTDPTYGGLQRAAVDRAGNEVVVDSWTLQVRESGAADWRSLDPAELADLFVIFTYTVS